LRGHGGYDRTQTGGDSLLETMRTDCSGWVLLLAMKRGNQTENTLFGTDVPGCCLFLPMVAMWTTPGSLCFGCF
jgi:hypothetical protein